MPAPADTRQQRKSGQQTACYVYGIVPADVEPTPDARGVGDPPAKVQVVRHGRVAALISEVDTAQPLGRPEDLMAHEELLDGTAAQAPVLPMRFGAVMTDSKAVAEELLAPHEADFAAALHQLEGRAEFIVKSRYHEQAILREVLSEDPGAAELAEQTRGEDEDATRDARIQLGEMINNAITAKREEDTRAIGDALASCVRQSSVRNPSHELDAANVAVLAETSRQEEIEDAVAELAKKWKGRAEVRLLGPLAPYDFVTAVRPEG
jgi:hypothetical protein